MEVSSKIKEEIRKTQSDLKNAIRVHQIWVARLQDDETNIDLISKVKEAEKDIIAVGQAQKLVVDRLRRELEMYQQRLKARNKQINIENDHRFVAQQLRDHHLQHRSRTRSVSLLKPSVLNEIHIKSENNHEDVKDTFSESENEKEKENSNYSEEERDKYQRHYSQTNNTVNESRNNFVNALNKAKESLIGVKIQHSSEWAEGRSDSDSSGPRLSLTPSPPLLQPGEPVTQESFLRLLGLISHAEKEIVENKLKERRKRATTTTNRTDFLYENYDGIMPPKRRKYAQFGYLQPHVDPPQTRSAKLRKQQNENQNRSSREGSPSGSSSENKGEGWSNGKPAWAASLPHGLSVEPVYPAKKCCHGCGRSDVPSLLVWCSACGVCVHTGCAGGRCSACHAPLPDPTATAASAPEQYSAQEYAYKIAERKRLQQKNIQLCYELRKLEARTAMLEENIDEHNAEKRALLAAQIKTQRQLQKLLDFIGQFKENSVSVQSTSQSESSEISKSNEE